MKKIAITMGDPAGVAPEIILKALRDVDVSNLLLIANSEIFSNAEKQFNIQLPKKLEFVDIPFDVSRIKIGVENKYSGELSYLCLKKACDLANAGIINAIATAPLSKNALHLAGHDYSGQTEILQDELSENGSTAQMLFVAENLRILLLTRHLPLKDICKNITNDKIIETVTNLKDELKSKFKIFNPHIAMCALNPHAGENGILGSEEIEIINPALKLLQANNIEISGAFSADTLLGNAVKNFKMPEFDAYIACYHDQALPAIKSLGLEKVLNITIGLKILRSSPSHGTAYDIAGQNKADYRSMKNAITFLQNLM